MDRDWAHERVVRFIAERTGCDIDSIGMDETLVALDMDSLEDVEFIMELEDELQKEIPYPTGLIVSVGDLVAYVRRAVKEE